MKKRTGATVTLAAVMLALPAAAQIQQEGDSAYDAREACVGLPTHFELKQALIAARGQVSTQTNGGLGNHMWASIVNRDGIVCAVVYTGNARGDQWPGSRVIAAQKANTANAFSLAGLALSTANLYSAVQPGGSLAGLQASNPVNAEVAYRGSPRLNGEGNDPMVGGRIGGVNIFGGGLGLYTTGRRLIGGVGVSGDTSCADHSIAWRLRHLLELDYLPGGVSGDAARPDNIVYDIVTAPGASTGVSASGWGHPECGASSKAIAAELPVKR